MFLCNNRERMNDIWITNLFFYLAADIYFFFALLANILFYIRINEVMCRPASVRIVNNGASPYMEG